MSAVLEEVVIVPVPNEDVIQVLPMVTGLLERGVEVDAGRIDIRDVAMSLVNGESQLWLGWDGEKAVALAVTSIVPYPAFKALSIDVFVGDNRKQWIHRIDTLEEWGRKNGCEKSEIMFARPGWGPLLPDYKKWRISLVKDL